MPVVSAAFTSQFLRRSRDTNPGALLTAAVLAVPTLGLEFLPKLEEGNLWIRATMPSTISLEEGNVYVNRMRAIIAKFPEVESVVSQQGRPDDGTDRPDSSTRNSSRR